MDTLKCVVFSNAVVAFNCNVLVKERGTRKFNLALVKVKRKKIMASRHNPLRRRGMVGWSRAFKKQTRRLQAPTNWVGEEE